MKKTFKLLCCLLIGVVFLNGCKGDDKIEPEPVPLPGAISGTISPAGAAKNIRITKDGLTTEKVPDANNNFTFDNLTAGSYTFNITPNAGFQAPQEQTVSVTAGNTTNLGTITLQRMNIPGITGTMSATVNSTPWYALAPYASFNNTTLTIAGPTASTTGGELLGITINNFNGLGTYNGPFNAIGAFSLTNGASNPPTWDTTTGSMSITISKYDQVNKKLSGTFSFTAKPSILIQGNTATGTKTITNGTFTDISFQ